MLWAVRFNQDGQKRLIWTAGGANATSFTTWIFGEIAGRAVGTLDLNPGLFIQYYLLFRIALLIVPQLTISLIRLMN